MMKKPDGDQSHALSGPENQTGESAGKPDGYRPPVSPAVGEDKPCWKCGREVLHRKDCSVYLRKVEDAVKHVAEEERVESFESTFESKKLIVQFIEHKTKEYILEVHLDYEMTGVLAAVGDFVSPFGAQDPRIYKVIMRHFVLDLQPVLAIYLEKI